MGEWHSDCASLPRVLIVFGPWPHDGEHLTARQQSALGRSDLAWSTWNSCPPRMRLGA